ncbi:MAG: hypothetical protein AB7S81_00955 [Bdellovibrionales bacterium]
MKCRKIVQRMRDVGRGVCAGGACLAAGVCATAVRDLVSGFPAAVDSIGPAAAALSAGGGVGVVVVVGCYAFISALNLLRRASSKKTAAVAFGATFLAAYAALTGFEKLESSFPQEPKGIEKRVDPNQERNLFPPQQPVQYIVEHKGQKLAVLKVS